MRFSAELNSRVKEVWREFYIQYSKLNIFLKNKVEDQWTDKNEYTFINNLETELKKVYTFMQTKLDETNRLIDQCAALLEEPDTSSVLDMLSEIIVDTNELAKFHALNMAGFKRIVLKHDTYTPHKMHDFFYGNMLEAYPLDEQRFDGIMIRLSKIYDFYHQKNTPRYLTEAADSPRKECETLSESMTDSYLIHPDNITELKALVLLHLSASDFYQSKQYGCSDTAMSSVHYDNDAFELYHARLSHVPGVDAIQMRWYGKSDAKEDVYVEKRTYPNIPSTKAIKNRFKLQECQVNEFVDSRRIAEQLAQDPKRESGSFGLKKEKDRFVIRNIRESILKRKLKPVCREFFHRTSFESLNSQRMKINMDTNITFIREDHMDGQIRRRHNKKQVNWRRLDVGIDYPFRKISDNDILRFPYAVLDVKMLTCSGQETPEWLNDLLNSHLVHKIPEFSRYVYGVSCLFEDRVRDYPPWQAELERDIRKKPVINIGLSRSKDLGVLFNGLPIQSFSPSREFPEQDSLDPFKDRKTESEAFRKDPIEDDSAGSFKEIKDDPFVEQVKEAIQSPPEVCDNDIKKTPTLDKTEEINLQVVISMEDNTSYRDKLEFGPACVRREGPKNIFSKYKPKFANEKDQELKESLSESLELGTKMNSRDSPRRFDAKAFFSNERTFMSWLQFCTILFTISLNLLNRGDGITRIVGSLFIVVSLFVSMYALFRFHFRAFQLRTGRASLRIDDIYGPSILCVLLIAALAVNFYLRIPYLFGT